MRHLDARGQVKLYNKLKKAAVVLSRKLNMIMCVKSYGELSHHMHAKGIKLNILILKWIM